MTRSLLKFAVILVLVAAAAGGGTAGLVAIFGNDPANRETAAARDAIIAVAPDGGVVDTARPITGTSMAADAVYEVRGADGRPVAWVAEGEEKGYSGLIRLLVSARRREERLEVLRVVILAQAETPGLGAQAALEQQKRTLWQKLAGSGGKDATLRPFLDRFAGTTQENVEDVQAITAATITSDAVKSAVDQALGRIRKALEGPHDRTDAENDS
jgi:RnfABCDGE-type electron transport complex G subunit